MLDAFDEGFNEFAESGVSGVTGGGLCSFDPARGSLPPEGAGKLLADRAEAWLSRLIEAGVPVADGIHKSVLWYFMGF